MRDCLSKRFDVAWRIVCGTNSIDLVHPDSIGAIDVAKWVGLDVIGIR
jgi:hypothetical protein